MKTGGPGEPYQVGAAEGDAGKRETAKENGKKEASPLSKKRRGY